MASWTDLVVRELNGHPGIQAEGVREVVWRSN